MSIDRPTRKEAARRRRLGEAIQILTALGFGPKQRNDTAAYTLLAMLDLSPDDKWREVDSPLRGIAQIIDFVAKAYGVRYAPNTRETIRDEAVKCFVAEALLVCNPDNPSRSTTSPKTAYQVHPSALVLMSGYGQSDWQGLLGRYLTARASLKGELQRQRQEVRIPVTFPDGRRVTLSPGGQNPLIKQIIEQFCPAFAQGGVVLYIGDTENKFVHLEAESLAALGVRLAASAKIPDVIVHDVRRNWLLLIEAVTSAGPVDGKRRNELKELFRGSSAGLVFVTAFPSRKSMQSSLAHIAWESEVWIAEEPDHLIHFNGERFLGPYADVSR
jgi:hypothetical protein